MKTVNLEETLPTVERARLLLQHEMQMARNEGCAAVKLIHGYGSSGTGGKLRIELQKELREAAQNGSIRALIPGEAWRLSDQTTWDLLKRFPEWKKDMDLGRGNQGVSIIVL